jgi:hypothetical protein
MSCGIDIPPFPLWTVLVVFIFLMFCVYGMCDCRLLLPVLDRTLEEMLITMMIIIFQLTNSTFLAFQNVNGLFSPE